ncbi:MAG: hypothetical protein A2Y79_02105 [Deltaproteobacteria bacterium RBG_13_43_22]|jgi:hypothetical protein|nr:MAG: hypothetical protein A2Y79_02105 [Deltaproteobacteria bacterium RBG_13_43_22]
MRYWSTLLLHYSIFPFFLSIIEKESGPSQIKRIGKKILTNRLIFYDSDQGLLISLLPAINRIF